MNLGMLRRLSLAGLVLASLTSGFASNSADTSAQPEAKTKAPAEPAAPAAKLETPAEYRTEFRLPSGKIVKRGMTIAEVQKLMGEPREKRPLKAGEETAEIWVYVTETSSSAPKTMHSETIVTSDNQQGWVETVSIPQYRIEQNIVSETRELLFFQGRLLNWKESRNVKQKMQ